VVASGNGIDSLAGSVLRLQALTMLLIVKCEPPTGLHEPGPLSVVPSSDSARLDGVRHDAPSCPSAASAVERVANLLRRDLTPERIAQYAAQSQQNRDQIERRTQGGPEHTESQTA
jgi:hypothetical protein